MQPVIKESRPPYVTFELRAVEDRVKSLEDGKPYFKDVAFAMITPFGSKDRFEQDAIEWLAKLEKEVANSRFPAEWYRGYKSEYDMWCAGIEAPLNGTSILNWPVLTPGQAKTIIALGLKTVEDLAVANEEALRRIGMGARSIKQKAEDFLAMASNSSKVVNELNVMRQSNQDLIERNKQLEGAIEKLNIRIDALSNNLPRGAAKPRGRTSKVEEDYAVI